MVQEQPDPRRYRPAGREDGVEVHFSALVVRQQFDEPSVIKIGADVPPGLPGDALARQGPVPQDCSIAARQNPRDLDFEHLVIAPETPHVDQSVAAGQTKAAMAHEIGRLHGSAEPFEIGRCRANDLARGGNLACNHAFVIRQPEAQDEIAVIDFILEADVGQDQMRLDTGMLRDEGREQGSKVSPPEIRRSSDAKKPSCHTTERRNLSLDIPYLLQYDPASLIEKQALVSEAKPA